MSVRVLRPGLLSTLQDRGRYGMQHLGIVPSGAMDALAHGMANALVGNEDSCATIECTIVGPELQFTEDSLVAIYGAALQSKGRGLPPNRPALVKAGTTIAVGATFRGSRAYLAIAGGFPIAPVLGSRSTYVPGGFGGFHGRPLQAGDELATDARVAELSNSRFVMLRDRTGADPVWTVRWSAPALTVPSLGIQRVRAMRGRHHCQFSRASKQAFFSYAWRISPNSNRTGFRLEGPQLPREKSLENLSEPTCLGTVQVPNDGQPIVLMADHQTTGGYPKIAEVASADIAHLAQMPPGSEVRFIECSVEEAQTAEDEILARMEAIRHSVRSLLFAPGQK
jgi:antagonist of KipI